MDLRNDNPKLERLDRKIRVLRTNLQYDNQRSAYDFVVLDTPPVTLIADAFEIMRFSDVNFFVMRQNYTRKVMVKIVEGMRLNGQLQNSCIVVNDYEIETASGYSYGYGYYEDEGPRKPKAWWKRLLP